MHFMSRFLSYYVSCLHNMLFKYIICYFYFSLPPFNPLVLRVHTQVHSSRRGQSTESGSDNTHLWLTQASCLSSLQKTNTITSASFLRLRQVVGVRVHITQQCLTSWKNLTFSRAICFASTPLTTHLVGSSYQCTGPSSITYSTQRT